MFYTVYKITNNINKKIYIGAHKTTNLDDNYMGSGDLIRKAIKKYGVNQFSKEYIIIFDNLEDMFKMESQLVNEDFIGREDTYNLKEGGNGGDTSKYISYDDLEYRTNIITGMKKYYDENPDKKEAVIQHLSIVGSCSFTGKHHTEEAKKKIGNANAKHQKGKKNSQYGTCWIHSLTAKVNKKIAKSELNSYLSKGWIKGRKIKL